MSQIRSVRELRPGAVASPSAHSREKSASTQHRRARRLRELRTRVCRVSSEQRMGLSKQEAQDPHSVRAQCTQPAAGQQAVDSRGTAPRCQPPVDRLTVQSISPLIPCGPAGSWLTVQRVNLRAPDLPRCAASASAARSGVPPPCSRHILFSDFCFCTGSGRCSCRAMSLHFPVHRAAGARIPEPV